MPKSIIYILTFIAGLSVSDKLFGQTYTIDTCSFNSDELDFSPTYYKNGLVYCSNRKTRVFSNYFDSDNVRVTDIYFWSDSTGVSEFQSTLNTKVHEGPICFTKDEDTLFCTQNLASNLKGFSDNTNHLGLYMKTLSEGKWSKPQKLPFVENNYSYTHPCFHGKSRRLYFASNMPGGKGGMDIYYSELSNGEWSSPINVGSKINTEGNELFPFIDASGILYFSTNYYSDSSDLDIYYSSFNQNEWSVPSILGAPINSSFDDFSYISDSTGDNGYFSSSRSGNDDIYTFSYVYPTFEECEENHKPSLCWEFAEEEAVELDTIPVVYKWTISTGDTIQGLSIDYCFPDTGYYEIGLSLYDTITGLAYMNVGEYALSIEAYNRPYIESSDTVSVNTSITLTADVSRLENYEILEYFWDLDEGGMRKGTSITLIPKEEGYLYPVLGVIALNKQSGEKEKLCAYKIIEVFEPPYIDTTELIASTEDNEIDIIEHIEAPNDTMMYTVQLFESDTLFETDDSLFNDFVNRVYPRYLDQKGTYSYEIMYSEDIASLYDDFTKAVESGFNSSILKQITKNALSIDTAFFTRLNNETLVNLIKSGAVDDIQQDNLTVYFEVNSHTIAPKYIDLMNKKCAEINKNSVFLIEGHTDANGSYDYNLALSERRVASVKDKLYKLGFKKPKMTSVWFGEKFAKQGDEKGLNDSDRKVTILIINI